MKKLLLSNSSAKRWDYSGIETEIYDDDNDNCYEDFDLARQAFLEKHKGDKVEVYELSELWQPSTHIKIDF